MYVFRPHGESEHMKTSPTNFARCPGLAAVAALALCLGVTAVAAQAPAANGPTLAVLPLANGSGDAAQDFFASGLTDEIAVALTGVRGLGVVARSSAFLLKPADIDIKAAGEKLMASHLVQGTAQVSGDRVRLKVRLVRAADRAQLWSQDYDAAHGDIFDIEEDVAGNIATALGLPPSPTEPLVRSRMGDFDTYLDFLRAKVAARPRGAKPMADAAAILERVVAREPNFAPAAALLSYSYALMPLFAPSLRAGNSEEERKIVAATVPRSDALARRATMLDPKSAEAFVALGYANMVQRRMAAAEDAFRSAIALNPNQADGLHGLSQLLAAVGRITESLTMREHLQTGEQFITNYTADTAEIYWLAGDTEKAVAMLQPFRPGRTLELALVLASAGRTGEAASALREMPASNYPSGMLESAAKILESAPAKGAAPGALPRIGNLSFAYMHVGAPERVLEFYEDEAAGNYFQPISSTWFWHPTYAPVRRTDRFKKVVRDLGLVDYWRARGWPAACRSAGTDDFICE
jgi:TolB-like protein